MAAMKTALMRTHQHSPGPDSLNMHYEASAFLLANGVCPDSCPGNSFLPAWIVPVDLAREVHNDGKDNEQADRAGE